MECVFIGLKQNPFTDYWGNEDGTIIKNPKGRLMKSGTLAGGYYRLGKQACANGASVHRFVYETWYEKVIPDGMVINHIDGVKTNNHHLNLECVTPSENSKHAYNTGLAFGKSCSSNSQAKLSDDDYEKVIHLICCGADNEYVAEKFNIHSRYVSLLRHGHRWKCSINSLDDLPRSFKSPFSKEQLIVAYELTQEGVLQNFEISRILNIEVSNISRIRHMKGYSKFIYWYEKFYVKGYDSLVDKDLIKKLKVLLNK